MITPTYEYINLLYEQTLTERATTVRQQMDEDARAAYFDTKAVDFPTEIRNPVAIALRMPYDVVQRLKGILSRDPFIKIEPIGLSEKAQSLTSVMEAGTNALFEQLEREAPYNTVFSKIKEDQIIYGRAYGKLLYAPDHWASYNAWVKDSMPELSESAQKLDSAEDVVRALRKIDGEARDIKTLTLLPLALRHMSAPSTFPILGTTSEYLYLSKKRVKEIIVGLEDRIYEGAPILLQQYLEAPDDVARARLLMQEVDYIEYYSNTHFAYAIKGSVYGSDKAGEMIRCEEHGYRMNPVVEFVGDTTSDPEYPYMGMMYPIIGIARGMNDLMSQMFTNIRHWVWTTLFLESKMINPGDGVRPEPFDIAYGQINPMYEGEKFTSLSQLLGPLNLEVPQLWNFLRGLFSLMTLSPVLSGIAEGDVSAGYAINSLRQGALTRWGTLVNNYNRGRELLAQLALNIIKYRIGETVVVHTGLKGNSKRSIIELDPTDFPDKVFFNADYQLKLPVDLAANVQIARMATEMRGTRPPLMSDSWARALLEDEAPEQTEAEIMKQEWKYSPAAWAFFTQKVLEEAGIALAPSPEDEAAAMLEMGSMDLPPNARAAMQQYLGEQQGGLGQGLANAQGMQESMGGRAAGQSRQPGGPNLP